MRGIQILLLLCHFQSASFSTKSAGVNYTLEAELEIIHEHGKIDSLTPAFRSDGEK